MTVTDVIVWAFCLIAIASAAVSMNYAYVSDEYARKAKERAEAAKDHVDKIARAQVQDRLDLAQQWLDVAKERLELVDARERIRRDNEAYWDRATARYEAFAATHVCPRDTCTPPQLPDPAPIRFRPTPADDHQREA